MQNPIFNQFLIDCFLGDATDTGQYGAARRAPKNVEDDDAVFSRHCERMRQLADDLQNGEFSFN